MAEVTFKLLDLEQGHPIVHVNVKYGAIRRGLKIHREGITWVKKPNRLLRWREMNEFFCPDKELTAQVPKSAARISTEGVVVQGGTTFLTVVAKNPNARARLQTIGRFHISRTGIKWLPHGTERAMEKGWKIFEKDLKDFGSDSSTS